MSLERTAQDNASASTGAQHAILLLRKRSRVVNESVALTRKTIIASRIIITKEDLRKVSSEGREKKERKMGGRERKTDLSTISTTVVYVLFQLVLKSAKNL